MDFVRPGLEANYIRELLILVPHRLQDAFVKEIVRYNIEQAEHSLQAAGQLIQPQAAEKYFQSAQSHLDTACAFPVKGELELSHGRREDASRAIKRTGNEINLQRVLLENRLAYTTPTPS